MRRRERDWLQRLEATGEMDRRRAEIRGYFKDHPAASPLQAVRAFGYAHEDLMYVVADSVRIDMVRDTNAPPDPGITLHTVWPAQQTTAPKEWRTDKWTA
jgi:hypothetical protein